MKNNKNLLEEISRIKNLIGIDSLDNIININEQWKPLGDFAADVIKKAKLAGKYVAKEIESADDVLTHFSSYKSLWKAANPAYARNIKTIETLIGNVISGKNSPFELVNGSPLYRAIPYEGNLRYNVIQAWRIKNNISDNEFKKLILSVSTAEKKSMPTVTPKTKVLDPKTAPEGTVWEGTLTVNINGKSQIFTGDKFIKNSDGTISKWVGGKEVDRIDINKMELDANKITDKNADEFTREVLNDIDDQVDDIQSNVTDDAVDITMDKKDRKFLLRYIIPNTEFFNRTYNIIRSFGGWKSPDTYLDDVKKGMDDFMKSYFEPYINRNISSLDNLSPASLQEFNTNLRKLILDFELSRKNTETFDQLWMSLKDDFLSSIDDMPVDSYLTKQEVAKLISKRKQVANKIISMCEKGTGEKGTYESINKFLEIMRPTTEDYSLFPSGVERSAWYDQKSFSKWAGLYDEWGKFKQRYSTAWDSGKLKDWMNAIFAPILNAFKSLGGRLVAYLITGAPLNFRKLVTQFKGTFRQGITAKKFGLFPEYLYEAAVTYIKWCLGKLLIYPFINLLNSTLAYIKAQLGYEADPRYAPYNPMEELLRGWAPLIEESEEWKKLFVTFDIGWYWKVPFIKGPGIQALQDIIIILFDKAKNAKSTKEQEEELDREVQEKLKKLGISQEDIDKINNAKTPEEKKDKLNDVLKGLEKEVDARARTIISNKKQSAGRAGNYAAFFINKSYSPIQNSELEDKDKRWEFFKKALDSNNGIMKVTNATGMLKSESWQFIVPLKNGTFYFKQEKNGRPYAKGPDGTIYKVDNPSDAFKLVNAMYDLNKENPLDFTIKKQDQIDNTKSKLDKLLSQSMTPIINKLIKEMNEGKKFGKGDFKRWKGTFKFKKYDDKTNQLKDVKITGKMDDIIDRIDHFSEKYDEDDAFVRAVIDVFGTGIDIIQYTRGLANLTEGIMVEGLMSVLSNLRESKEYVTWTVKHYKDGNWELVKGNFNKKELLNVGKTKKDREEKQKESENPAEGLKKKEQESIMILNRDEKEGLNGLPTKVKEKVKEKLRQGWTTEKPFDFLITYYTESEINSVFNDKIKIYKLKPSAEFFRTLAKNSSKVTIKKGFCKSVKNAKGDYDLSEKEKTTLNHFISKCGSKFGI